MKQLNIKLVLSLLMSLTGLSASAHDIEVKNAQGKTIYYNYINEGTELEVTFRGSIYDSYSNEYQGNVVIPEEVTYMNRTRKVTSIGNSAFWGCTGLTSVTIPNSVTSIGVNAFYYCYDLTSVTIPNSVTSIGAGAFDCCIGLTSITIPNSVTSIGDYAFRGCMGLTSVHITDIAAWCKINFSNYNANPLSNAKHLFMDGKEITDLVIPNSVTSIGVNAFVDCSGLTSVTIPNSVTSIGGGAFSGCSGLTTVTIPNGVKSIDERAFSGCSSLTSVTIGSGVTSIGYKAFDGADIPTVVSLIENPSAIRGKADDYFRTFSQNTFLNATLYVPYGTKDKYKATYGWKDFVFIEELDFTPKYKLAYMVDGVEYKSYELEYGATITPEPAPTKEGYTFSGWSEIPETMPAYDVTVTGSFAVNQYLITYMIGDEVYQKEYVDYGATIVLPNVPEREGYSFAWIDAPEKMPAHDITINGAYTSGMWGVSNDDTTTNTYTISGYKTDKPRRGVNIIRMSDGTTRKVVVK